MKYSLGESLADFGFHFLEKLHEPIFLVNKVGKLVKVNEAGRKFLCVTNLPAQQIQRFLSESILNKFTSRDEAYQRMPIGTRSQVIARSFVGSDLVLIEVKK